VEKPFLRKGGPFGLWRFSPSANEVSQNLRIPGRGSADVILFDFDQKGKQVRQDSALGLLGRSTTIAIDTLDDLRLAARISKVPIIVRLPHIFSSGAQELLKEILALEEGRVSGILLSMVEDPHELKQVRREIGGGMAVGVMLETKNAIAKIVEFTNLKPDFYFVGLVDLALAQGSSSIFEPILSGELSSLVSKFESVPFGFGAATTVGSGHPVPNELLLSEMVRLGASFTFLRTAFAKDVGGLDYPQEMVKIRELLEKLDASPFSVLEESHQKLLKYIEV
jgi:hypothetical protein